MSYTLPLEVVEYVEPAVVEEVFDFSQPVEDEALPVGLWGEELNVYPAEEVSESADLTESSIAWAVRLVFDYLAGEA